MSRISARNKNSNVNYARAIRNYRFKINLQYDADRSSLHNFFTYNTYCQLESLKYVYMGEPIIQ